MKNYWILLFVLLIGTLNLHAQDDSYEAWRKKKQEKYDKWKKMRADIVSHLPSNPQMDAIGSFIDAGFGDASASTTSAPNAVSVSVSGNPAVTQPANNPIAMNPNMKIWVVVVGVADYELSSAKLNYTDDDAYKMYAFYKSPEGGSIPDKQIRVLIDEEATRNNVITAIRDVYSQAGKDDAIIFYFSGHGSNNAFITYEFDGYAANNKGIITHDELNDVFDQSPAKYKYLIADACHSGNSVRKRNKSAASTESAFYQTFENNKGGFVMLLSSMGEEYSLELSGIRQGVFSHFMIRGLKGEADSNKDRVVSVIELFDFVKQNVQERTQYEQNPVISGNYDERLPISMVRN